MSMSQLRRVTVVNDSPDFLELMRDFLHDADYPATLIDGDRDNAMDLVESSQPEILIIDLRLGRDELKGLDILHQIRAHPDLGNVPTIVCTADLHALERAEDEIQAMKGVSVLTKPFALDDLHRALREVASP